MKKQTSFQAYRWIVYAVLLLSYVMVNFHKMSLGAVKEDLTDLFGITTGQFSSLNSAYFLSYAIIQIPVGVMVDTMGPRKTAALGTFFMGFGTLVYAFGTGFGMLFVARVLVGLGAGVMFLCLLKIQATWYEESKFGSMTGVTMLFGNLGSAFAQAPLTLLVAALSWKLSFSLLAGITIVLAILILLLARDTPESLGFPPVSALSAVTEERVSVREGMSAVLRNRYVYPVIASNFLTMGIFSVISTWGLPYLTEVYEIPAERAGTIMFFFPLVASLGCFLYGRLSDAKQNRKIINLVMTTVVTGFVAVLGFAGDVRPPFVIAAAIMVLFGFGQHFSINFGFAKDVLPIKYSGMATSLVNFGTFVGGSIIPAIFGRIIEANMGTLGVAGAYQLGFRYMVAFGILLFLVDCCLLETNCRNHAAEIAAGTYKKSIFALH